MSPEPPPSSPSSFPSYNEELRLPATLTRIAAYHPFIESHHRSDRRGRRLPRQHRRRRRNSSETKFPTCAWSPTRRIAAKVTASVTACRKPADDIVLVYRRGSFRAHRRSRKATSRNEDHDVAIGSRAMDRSLITVHESPFREFAGIVFNKIVRLILRLPFVDTQCGFKAFRRDPCRIIFEQQTIERFGFDPELLYLARHHGLRSVEIPVRWGHSPATKVNMLRDSVQMFIDVFVIRWNSLTGKYPRRHEITSSIRHNHQYPGWPREYSTAGPQLGTTLCRDDPAPA